MIEFAKQHPVLITFCVIGTIFVIAFILCLLHVAKDPVFTLPEINKEKENED